jgi:phosphoenolpyruvate carboxylase
MTDQAAIQRDIEWLDAALRQVVREQHGAKLAGRLDRLFERYDAANLDRLATALDRLEPDQMRAAVRYAAVRLELMNLAEDHHRLRVLRAAGSQHPDPPRRGSIADAAAMIRRRGGRPDKLLDQLDIELVITAHPTDAKRRTIRHAWRRVRRLLAQHDRKSTTSSERDHIERQLHAVLTAVWQTDLVRPQPPTVRQEIQRGLNVARRLWSVVPRIYQDLREATGAEPDVNRPAPLRFGSWIGGDRDGHPLVTHKETDYALRAGRRMALKLHYRTASKMLIGLSLSSRKQPVDPAIKRTITAAVKKWPALQPRVEGEPVTELYRRFGRVIQWRLKQALHDREGGYGGPGDLIADLQRMRDSLASHRARAVAEDRLADWLAQVQTFGFHMFTLDVRQDSRVYAEVIDELLRRSGLADGYLGADEAARRSILRRTRGKIDASGLKRLSEPARQAIALFRLLRRTLADSPGSIGGHVVSMTHEVSDVLAVHWLLAAVRDEHQRSDPPLRVIPLFETIDDLRRAGEVLRDLFATADYRKQLKRVDDKQIAMIGYSDSTKDGGYLAACWALYRGQIDMHDVADEAGVKLTFFHGRGGSLGRGGGPAARSITSLPTHTVHGAIRITEQGEVLVERYDDPRIGYRHLEQIVGATLLTIDDPDDQISPAWTKRMDELADRSLTTYRQLVERDRFVEYFRTATPIEEIERLDIGSRPSRRRAQSTLADLRAIPWVFAWTQSRHLIPAWYGLGALGDELTNAQRLKQLRTMYERWGLFRAVFDNAALAMAKFEPNVGRRYAALAGDDLKPIWQAVADEASRATQVIERITGVDHVLDNVEWLRDSVASRNPWISPLNLTQILLLRRLRESQPNRAAAAEMHELLRKSIYGVAAGVRTTG